jgi:S-adenosylmethionine-dependent methyltransferase
MALTTGIRVVRRVLDGIQRRIGDARIPPRVRANFRPLTPEIERDLRGALEQHYHVGWRGPEAYSPGGYRRDVETHVSGRLNTFRTSSIPWLSDTRSLVDLRVLEIGCGTGSSTLALAEQGARVSGIDLDLGALEVARRRLDFYGLDADIRPGNAADIGHDFKGERFDLVLYFATLEHMTIPERITSLRQAWDLLEPGGHLGVIEAPNRLWVSDVHTSQVPFFNWLPDDLAFMYAPFSPRENFRELYGETPKESMEHFLRRGRGVSFHEFEVSIAPVGDLIVSESMAAYVRRRSLKRLPRHHRRYQRYLRQHDPRVQPAFLEEFLDALVHKPVVMESTA